jgi:hypothetical protein
MWMTVVKWISLPVLLTGSRLARFTGNYEIGLNFPVCAGALVVVQRAVYIREYLWAAAFVDVAMLLSFASTGGLAGAYAAWKPQPLESL